jgi:hypothetical protein
MHAFCAKLRQPGAVVVDLFNGDCAVIPALIYLLLSKSCHKE